MKILKDTKRISSSIYREFEISVSNKFNIFKSPQKKKKASIPRTENVLHLLV